MLPILTLRNLNNAGQTQQGLVEDISTKSLQSVRFGEGAGKLSTGNANAFVGYQAGYAHRSGSYATYVGFQAGAENTDASSGTFVGAYAGKNNRKGQENVFVGFRTGEKNLSGSDCVAVGAYAMRENASGNYSVAVGYAAGERCLDGSFNTMIGAESGQDNRSGSFNTMAGFRSGRSAFMGNFNTYFGAYAGYSNNNGDGNCFIGFKSGESLANGSFNIAIGTYSLANATLGDSNISIGPYTSLFNKGSGNVTLGMNAGASNYDGHLNVVLGTNAGISNQGSHNVIIGDKSAPVWDGDCNVLIGSEVAPYGIGAESVIIGYRAAGTTYLSGYRNIFIGNGTDSIRSNVDNSISIGTSSVRGISESVSIGKNIENEGLNSITMGFTIQTNAENSVLVGKSLIITSAIYFKDPLNLNLQNIVLSDATDKFGISNIAYNNLVLGEPITPYPSAEFGYNKINVYNTTSLPSCNLISPITYDLQEYLASIDKPYALYIASNLFYTDPSQDFSSVSVSNIIARNTHFNRNNTSYRTNGYPVLENSLVTESYYTDIIYDSSNTDSSLRYDMVLNINNSNISNYVYPIHIVKKHIYPLHRFINDSNIVNTFIHPHDITLATYIIPSLQLSNETYLTSEGLSLPSFSKTRYILKDYPEYGILNKSSWENFNELVYIPYPESSYARNDAFSFFPTGILQDARMNLYGLASNQYSTVHIDLYNDKSWVQNALQLTGSVSTFIDSNVIRWSSNGSFEKTSNQFVEIMGFDCNVFLRSSQYLLTCNQALNYPLPIYTCNLSVNVDNGAFIINNVTTPELNLIKDHIYVFSQIDACNVDYQLRFSTTMDGTNNNGAEYITGITKYGIPGVNGVTTFTVSETAPNVLYYYASNHPIAGGRINILPHPTGPIRIRYKDILDGKISLSNQYPSDTLYDPLYVKVKDVITPITLFTTSNALWQSTCNITNSTVNIISDYATSSIAGPNIPYHSGFIENYPIYGSLVLGSSSNLNSSIYQPFDRWSLRQDKISYILKNPTNNKLSKRHTWNITNIPERFVTENIFLNTRTSNIFSAPDERYVLQNAVSFSNIPLNHVTYYTCNVKPLNQTLQQFTYDPGYEFFLYDRAIGQKITTINKTVSESLAITTTGESNVNKITYTSNVYIYETDITNEILIPTSNIIITITEEINEPHLPYSNLTIIDTTIVNTRHNRLYYSNIDLYHTILDSSNVYDPLSNVYVYTDTNQYYYNFSNIINVNELNDGDTEYGFAYSNLEKRRTLKSYRPLQHLHRTTLFEPSQPSTIHWLNTSEIQPILETIGPVTSFNYSNLTNNTIWFESKITNTNNYTITIPYSVANNDTVNTYNLRLSAYYPQSSITQTYTIPTVANTNPPLEMTVNYSASLINVEAFLRSSAQTYFDGSFTPTHICFTHIEKGYLSSNLKNITKVPLPIDTNTLYHASGRYDYDTFHFYYTNDVLKTISRHFKYTSFVYFQPINNVYTTSYNISKWVPFSSNTFFITNPEKNYDGIYVLFKNLGDQNVSVYQRDVQNTPIQNDIMSWSNLTSGKLYIQSRTPIISTDDITRTLTYNLYKDIRIEQGQIYIFGDPLLQTDKSIQIKFTNFLDFPQPSETTSNALEIIQLLQESTCNVLDGYIKTFINEYTHDGGVVIPSRLKIYQEIANSNGFLWNSTSNHNIQRHFTYQNILNGDLRFIPYIPMSLSNESLQVYLSYDDYRSPSYTIQLKNFFYKTTPKLGNVTKRNTEARTIDLTTVIRSHSFYQERNDINISTELITLPFSSNTGFTSYTCNINIEFPSKTRIYSSIPVQPSVYSFPIIPKTNNFSISVDQSDAVSLKALLSSIIVDYDIKDIDDLLVYLDKTPTYGIIRYNNSTDSNLSRWSLSNLLLDNIYYQHLGNEDTLPDIFSIRYATTPYNISEAVTIQVNVHKLPKLLGNRFDNIYEISSNTALDSVYQLSKTIRTDIVSNVYLHQYEASNIHIVNNGITQRVLSLDKFSLSNYGYQLSSNYFTNHISGTPYEPLQMQFMLSSNSSYHEHSLINNELYKHLFLYNWDGYFNRFESSNIDKLPNLQNTLQDIKYTFDLTNIQYIQFQTFETNISITFEPYHPLFNKNYIGEKGTLLVNKYASYSFDIICKNFNLETSLWITINNDYIDLIINNVAYSAPISIPSSIQKIQFNVENQILLVVNDGAYDGYLSVYINPDNTKTLKDNQSKNILRATNIKLKPDLTALYTITLESYANDINNYHENIQDVYTADANYDTEVYANLINHTNRLYVKNFELYARAVSETIQELTESTYNIVIGKDIEVKGKNNICLGTNFSTLGRNSIILGNDIGQSEASINQIYESIIIGNTSFQGSIVRGIISIGRGIMNNLVEDLSIGLTNDSINEFIAKRPILIGNDITRDKVDYHLNIANTLLLTSVGNSNSDQIYLGNAGEIVAIGYHSNEHLQGPDILYVNGGIRAKKITTEGGYLDVDILRASNIITGGLETSGGVLSINAMNASNIYASNIITDRLQTTGGVLNIEALNTPIITNDNSNVYIQLLNSSNLIASNITVLSLTTSAIQYPEGNVEFVRLRSSNLQTDYITASNVIISNGLFIDPNAIGNVITDGLKATIIDRFHKVFIPTENTNLLQWSENGTHFVDEADVEVYLNGIKLSYFSENKHHYQVQVIYAPDFEYTTFVFDFTDTVFAGDVVDIHVQPKLAGLNGNVYDYFAITSNVLNLKTVDEFYAPNATFSNIRILGESIIGNSYDRTAYQVEPIHNVYIPTDVTYDFDLIKSGYYEASPFDLNVHVNGSKLVYVDSNNYDYTLTSNFSLVDKTTTFTVTLDDPALLGDVVDITLFPKQRRDQFGYLYQNFEIVSPWSDDLSNVTIASNVGIGTTVPTSKLHVEGNTYINGELTMTGDVRARKFYGSFAAPWHLHSNLPVPLLKIRQDESSVPIAEFLYYTTTVCTITTGGIGVGKYFASAPLHSDGILIGDLYGTVTESVPPLNITKNDAYTRVWATSNNTIAGSEWILGLGASPSSPANVWWDAYISANGSFQIRDRTNNINVTRLLLDKNGNMHTDHLYTSNVDIYSDLSINNNLYVANQIITPSIFTDITTANIVNSDLIYIESEHASLRISQTINSSNPLFYASTLSKEIVISSNGFVGIGTSRPIIDLDIYARSGIRIPVGATTDRPQNTIGVLRYNDTTGEYEGCYPQGWGTLGGVKSFDGNTRISTLNNQLTLLTNNASRMIVDQGGNIGIGTTITKARLHVDGDMLVEGDMTFSNLRLLSKDIFLNVDTTSFRNRLQIQPHVNRILVPLTSYTQHVEFIQGIWHIVEDAIDIYVNGTKMVYMNSNLYDFNCYYEHIDNFTKVTISFDPALGYQDVLDISIWPRYLPGDESFLQPGYLVHNVYTYWNRDINSNISYFKGNVGIGTGTYPYTLTVNGTIGTESIVTSNFQTYNFRLEDSVLSSNQLLIRSCNLDISYIDIKAGEKYNTHIFQIDANGNVGIGTIPTQKLHISGSMILSTSNENPSITLQNTKSNQTWVYSVLQSNANMLLSYNDKPIWEASSNDYALTVYGNHFVKNAIYVDTIHTSNIYSSGSNVKLERLYIYNRTILPSLEISNETIQEPVLIVSKEGNIGIGTYTPLVSLEIDRTDAIRIPKGTTSERPVGQEGYIRYNTLNQQFEGFGAGGQWGSLGGVKSVDGNTYITAESSPGANDSNIRLYTSGQIQAIINPKGNVGIGTLIPSQKLHVNGDAFVSGTIMAPYLNITGRIFYNEDSPALRNRLQLRSTSYVRVMTQSNVSLFNIIVDGVWKIDTDKVQVHVNGKKLIYISNGQQDYTTNYEYSGENTSVFVTLTTPIHTSDIIDIEVWPSYLNTNALTQSGIIIQNFTYTIWNSNSSGLNTWYNVGNVGIGTSSPTHKLHVNGSTRLDGQVSAIRQNYTTGGIFGTDVSPINGGTVTINLSTTDNPIIELSSGSTSLTILLSNIASNIGKRVEVYIIERAPSGRSITVDTNIKFKTVRPSLTTANGVDRLIFTVVKSNLIIGEYTTNVAAN